MATSSSTSMLDSGFGTAKLLSCLVQIALLFLTLVLIVGNESGRAWDSFIFWSRYGTAIAIASLLLYVAIVGRFMTPMTLVMLAFVAFQFGIPILYGLDKHYTNWYVGSLSVNYLNSGVWFTVFCIQVFVLGASFAHRHRVDANGEGRERLFAKRFLTDAKSVRNIAAIGFVLTGVVAFARAILFLRTSLASGIGVARAAYELGTFENIARGLFVPFGLLLLVYLPKGKKRSTVFILLLTYSFTTLFSGDRTEGLTLMATLVFFAFEHGATNKGLSLRVFGASASFFAMIWLLVFVAQSRMGNTASIEGITDAVVSALNETGFNSLTVGFQMSLNNPPSCGMGYLSSFGSFIPNSFDIFGIKDGLDAFNPVDHYYETMGCQYSWATFGLGYSLIAEAFSNFGYLGWVMIGILGAIIERAMSFGGNTQFEKYLSLVFLWSFLTLPRRSTAWLINSFKWNLLFVLIILWIWYQLNQSRMRADSNKLKTNRKRSASL